MGVDCRAFISSKWSMDDIKTIIEARFKTKVVYRNTHMPEYVVFDFVMPNGDSRNLSVFMNHAESGHIGTLLSFNVWGQAEEILTAVVRVTGGFLQPNDCHDVWRSFDCHTDQNIGFLAKMAACENPALHHTTPEFIEYLKDYVKKYET